MSEPEVDRPQPPDDLGGFPVLHPLPPQFFRIAFHRDPTGELNWPWRFSSVPPGACRFALPVPQGTCYWSDRRYGAFVEVFRSTPLVDRTDVTRRGLFTAVPPASLRMADTTACAAYAHGVTGELSTVARYSTPQAWAGALHRARFAGMTGFCRHDPSLTPRNVALFRPSGVVARRAGWRTQRRCLEADPVLATELAALGVRIAPIPYRVTTIPAPNRRS